MFGIRFGFPYHNIMYSTGDELREALEIAKAHQMKCLNSNRLNMCAAHGLQCETTPQTPYTLTVMSSYFIILIVEDGNVVD